MRRIIGIGIIVFFVLSGWLSAGYIWPSLQQELDKMEPDEIIRVHIYLLERPGESAIKTLVSLQARRGYLKNFSRRSQKSLLSCLTDKEGISNIRAWWTSNSITITATKGQIKEIAKREDVDYIEEDYTIVLEPEWGFFDPIGPNFNPGLQWNIKTIRADEVWDSGITGRDVVVGFIDSGVDATHPAIKGNRRAFDSWFDAIHPLNPNPHDDIGHGTHCTGITMGQNGIGVAPGAQWVMARAFEGGVGQSEWIKAAFEWYAEMDDPPDILSNSWGSDIADRLTYWNDVWTMRNLKIKVVFSAGNSGHWTSCTPGNYPTVMAVGATNENDDIAGFSSRGPAPNKWPWTNEDYWLRTDWNLIVPTISAPGVQILSSVPGGGYVKHSGTSMACPHIAGVIALMLDKVPDLTFQEIYCQITNTAFYPDPTLPWPNNDYGWGRVDALAAVDIFGPKPKKNGLGQNRPNPFKKSTIISYNLVDRCQVTLKIYDSSGRLVRTLLAGNWRFARYWQIKWDGRNDYGNQVLNGVYFCYFEARNQKGAATRDVRKIVVVR